MASLPSSTSLGLSLRASSPRKAAAQVLALILSKMHSSLALPSKLGSTDRNSGPPHTSPRPPSMEPAPSPTVHCPGPACLVPLHLRHPLHRGFWGCRMNGSRRLPLPRKLQESLFSTVQSTELYFTSWGHHPPCRLDAQEGTSRAAPPGVPDTPPHHHPSVRGCGMNSVHGGLQKKASENQACWILPMA